MAVSAWDQRKENKEESKKVIKDVELLTERCVLCCSSDKQRWALTTMCPYEVIWMFFGRVSLR
jgi:hypothetical protein